MKKKIWWIILGLILVAHGVYQVYMGLWGHEKDHEEQARESFVFLGESIADKNGVSFCVTSVEDTQSVGSGFTVSTTANNYIVVSVTITNGSNEPYDVNSLRFVLADGDTQYESSGDALLSLDNHMYMDTINPGLQKSYVLVYETPFKSDERDVQLRVLENAFSNQTSAYIALRSR